MFSFWFVFSDTSVNMHLRSESTRTQVQHLCGSPLPTQMRRVARHAGLEGLLGDARARGDEIPVISVGTCPFVQDSVSPSKLAVFSPPKVFELTTSNAKTGWLRPGAPGTPTAQRKGSSSPTRHPPPNRSPQRHSPARHSPTRHSPTRHSPTRHSPTPRATRHSPTRPRWEGSPTSTTPGSDHLPNGTARRNNRTKMHSPLDMEDDDHEQRRASSRARTSPARPQQRAAQVVREQDLLRQMLRAKLKEELARVSQRIEELSRHRRGYSEGEGCHVEGRDKGCKPCRRGVEP